jgi:glycosyltransferase involved in cell wall biosynthesis
LGLKILQLSKKPPYPLRDGESIAISYLSKALTELGCEMSLLTMATPKHQVELEKLIDNCKQYKDIHVVQVDNSVKVFDAFVNLFKIESYHVSRFISQLYADKLADILQSNSFDIIQLETLYLTAYIPVIRKYSSAKICMRSHNVEHEIWERMADNSNNPVKKFYLNYLAKRLKEYEIDNLNEYDFLISVSERDLQKHIELGYKNEAIISPIGINLARYKKENTKNLLTEICFIGALDWMPNVEGLSWFLEKVWPVLHSRNPKLKFHIAGRNVTSEIKNLASQNVVIHGEVVSAIEYMNGYEIMVVPLLSGSGTRVKILEGMSLGKAIVTTSIGKEGIMAIDKEHLLVADTPIEFISAIEALLLDEYMRINICKNAEEFIKSNYDYLSNAESLLNNYRMLV